jgi:hypothetical protein
MMAQFKMSDMGTLSFYRGIEVHQKRGVLLSARDHMQQRFLIGQG